MHIVGLIGLLAPMLPLNIIIKYPLPTTVNNVHSLPPARGNVFGQVGLCLLVTL